MNDNEKTRIDLSMSGGLVLVESPYRNADAIGVAYAQWAMLDATGRGEIPIASHLVFTQLFPEDKAGRARGLMLRDRLALYAERIAVYTDLGISDGMREAIQHARIHGIDLEERKICPEALACAEKGIGPSGSLVMISCAGASRD